MIKAGSLNVLSFGDTIFKIEWLLKYKKNCFEDRVTIIYFSFSDTLISISDK